MIDYDCRHQLAALIQRAETLQQAIADARRFPSTINEHWDTLVGYGIEANEVLEFGCGYSTLAWLSAGANVTSVDIEPMPWTDRLVALARGRLDSLVADDLQLPPRSVPLLYIDTHHIYAQLAAELARHGPHAERIILHDTESFRDQNAPLTRQYCPGDRGLWPAVSEFCEASGYHVAEHFTHQHGLTILEPQGASPGFSPLDPQQ